MVILIYFTFPETKNLTTEEIAIVFDDEQAMGIVKVSKIEKGVVEQEHSKDGGTIATDHVSLSN